MYSQNDVRLFGQLLRKGPDEQSQLQLYACRSKQLNSKHAHPEFMNEWANQQSMFLPQRNNSSPTSCNLSSSPLSSAHYTSLGGVTKSSW
jgi:hypothetical protein